MSYVLVLDAYRLGSRIRFLSPILEISSPTADEEAEAEAAARGADVQAARTGRLGELAAAGEELQLQVLRTSHLEPSQRSTCEDAASSSGDYND